jgi:hypothetical protein
MSQRVAQLRGPASKSPHCSYVLLISLYLLFAPSAQAKEKEQIFPAPCEKVWQAALEVAGEHYEAVRPLKSEWTLLFDTGNSYLTGESTISVRFVPRNSERCAVSASGHFRGFIHRDTKAFLDRLAKKLKQQEREAPDAKK